jgi:hypothetical protein
MTMTLPTAGPHQIEPAAWARTHFAGAKMGDRRRTRRVETIAQAMAEQPGRSIPELFARK